jgi:membrane protein required for colicin V production
MNWLDYTFIGIFLVCMFAGAARGLTRGVIGLIATVAGILLACRYYAEPGWRLRPYFNDSRAVANGVGFLLILCGTMLLGALLGWLLSKVFKSAGIGWLDRLGGVGFGFVQASLISIALVMIGMAFPRTTLPQLITHSRFATYFVHAAGVLIAITPDELKADFWKNYEEVQKVWKDAVDHDKKKFPEAQI